MKNYFLLTLLVLTGYLASAQFVLSGEVRPRSEFRNGFKTLRTEQTQPAFFTEQRSRIKFDYNNEFMQLRISLQDIRIWGGASQIYKADPSLNNVNEAWASAKVSESFRITVGRQMLNYDNARILGNLEWAQQSRSHDALVLRINEQGSFKVDIGVAYNQETVNARIEPARLFETFYSGVNNYKAMQYAWLNQSYDGGQLSVLGLRNTYQQPDSSTAQIITTGLYWKHDTDVLGLTAEGYYQTGDQVINAYMAAAQVLFKFGKNKVGLGADYMSGTDMGSTENSSFNPLFGTNHKFYGFMDYFYVGNAHQNVGLIDPYFTSNFKLSSDANLIVNYHYFLAQATVLDDMGAATSGQLGSEIDLVLNYNMVKGVNLKLGLSGLLPTENMGYIKNGNTDLVPVWGWAMMTFKPTLFSTAE